MSTDSGDPTGRAEAGNNEALDLRESEIDEKATTLPRFGLWALFYVTAVVAAAVALLGLGGIIWACVVILFWWMRISELKKIGHAKPKRLPRANSSTGFTSFELLIVIIIIVILVGMLLPFSRRASPLARERMLNHSRIRQVMMAIHNYESSNLNFPPAYIADENGKPMHSWRVLILPYIEEQAVFDQYDFDEPWDGPNNSKLVDQLQNKVYFGLKEDGKNYKTGFKLVSGPGTAFVKDKETGFDELTGGSTQTIALLDDTANRVNWMSPDDLTIDDAVELFDRERLPKNGEYVSETKFEIRNNYFSFAGVFDASTTYVGTLEDPSVMRSYFTVEDDSEIGLEDLDFDFQDSTVVVKPEGYILVGLNLFLALLPVIWVRESHGLASPPSKV